MSRYALCSVKRWLLVVSFLIMNGFAFAHMVRQLSPETGWIATHRDLFWTTKGGTEWANITPPQRATDKVISAVFFLNASQGWVVLARHDNAKDTTFFWIATTADTGATWSSHALNIPELYQGNPAPILDDNVSLQFWDAQQGILNILHGGSFLTSDGGETWKKTALGAPGPLLFANRNDGWQLGESARMDYDGELFVTHDGSRTWREVILPSPPNVNTRYDLPMFTDGQRGFLVARYSGPDFEGVGLFSTANAGKSWKQDHLLRADFHTMPVVRNGAWILARAGANRTLSLANASGLSHSIGTTDTNLNNLESISFVDGVHGWAVGSGQLMSTADSGATWANISPKPIKLDVPKPGLKTGPLPPPSKPSGNQPPAGAPPSDVSIHLGFDKNKVFTIPQMQTWWNSSPYFDAIVYIPHSANKAADPNLNVTWVSNIQTQGWGIMPVWFGYQPSTACYMGGPPGHCTQYFQSVIPSNTQSAYNLGVSEANQAIQAMTSVGPYGLNLSGPIIYKNLENYVIGTDGAAIQAYLSGWTTTLHGASPSFLAGVYGNSGPAAQNFSKVTPLPDDVWVAAWNYQASTWGIWPLGGPTDTSLWINDQRIHQFRGDHFETHGGVGGQSLGPIDTDIEDAVIINNSAGVKPYTYTWQAVQSPIVLSNGQTLEYLNDVNDPVDDPNYLADYIAGTYTYALDIDPLNYGILYPGSLSTYTTLNDNIGYMKPVEGTSSINGQIGGPMFSPTVIGYEYDEMGGNSSRVSWAWTSSSGYNTLGTPDGLQGGPVAINDAGQIVGTVTNNNADEGYIQQGAQQGASQQLLSYPGSQATLFYSINGEGQIVGYYVDQNNRANGFIYSAADGWQTINYSADQTILYKINNNGWIFGYDCDTGAYFIYYNGGFIDLSSVFPTNIVPCEGPVAAYSFNDFADLVGLVVSNNPCTGGPWYGLFGQSSPR